MLTKLRELVVIPIQTQLRVVQTCMYQNRTIAMCAHAMIVSVTLTVCTLPASTSGNQRVTHPTANLHFRLTLVL